MLISAKDIIKKTISLYRENFKIISPYLLMLFAVTGILSIIQSVTGTLGTVTIMYGYGFFTLIYFILVVVAIVLTMWLSIALVKMIAKIYNQEKPNELKIELQKSTHLIIPAFLISLLVGLIVILGIVVLVIPGIFLGILLTFAYYAVIVDEHKVVQSLKISTNLVKYRWWATFWRLLVPSVLFTIVLLIIQWLISLPTNVLFSYLQTGTPLHIFLLSIFSLISTLIGVFFTPLTTFPTVILYEELKKTPHVKSDKKTREEAPTELPKL